MKKARIVILVAGVLIAVFTGFNFITKEKVVAMSKLEITDDKSHNLTWSPLIGLVVIIISGGVYLGYRRKSN